MQDCNIRDCYHSHDLLDSLDDESDKDRSKDENDKEDAVPDPDVQDIWITLAAKNALKNSDYLLQNNINLET